MLLLRDLLEQQLQLRLVLDALHAQSDLALVDAAFAVGDELVQRKRLPSLGGVREQGSKLLSQILTLSGAWSPEAPALVSLDRPRRRALCLRCCAPRGGPCPCPWPRPSPRSSPRPAKKALDAWRMRAWACCAQASADGTCRCTRRSAPELL